MNRKFVLKHDVPGVNAGTQFEYDERNDTFITRVFGKQCNIPVESLKAAGQTTSDWFEVESDETFTKSQVLQFGEHIKQLCQTEQTVKPYYELQKFFKKS